MGKHALMRRQNLASIHYILSTIWQSVCVENHLMKPCGVEEIMTGLTIQSAGDNSTLAVCCIDLSIHPFEWRT